MAQILLFLFQRASRSSSDEMEKHLSLKKLSGTYAWSGEGVC